jgi:predicted ATPase
LALGFPAGETLIACASRAYSRLFVFPVTTPPHDKEPAMPRYVLTGTPGAGKTAVLRLLESKGQVVVEEAATDVIALEQSLCLETPWTGPAFIEKILSLQSRRQAGVRAAETETVFFDRSPVCTLALSRYVGLVTSSVLAAEVDRVVRERVYERTVFFIRNQGFVQPTAARRISFEDSVRFEQIHEQTYLELGFRLVDVPAGPLADRVSLVQRTVDRLLCDGAASRC